MDAAEPPHVVLEVSADVPQGEALQPLPAPSPSPPAALPTPPPAAQPASPAQPPPTLPMRPASLPPSPQAAERPDETAPLELGVGTFLMAGGGSGGYMGVAPFVMGDVGQAVFVRPSVAIGQSVATNLPSTWAAARLDTCMRLPGRYAVRGGLQLDLCGGADVGFSFIPSGTQAGAPATAQTLPYIDIGPSLDLRAEVGTFAVTLRGVAGVDVAREGFDDVNGTRVDAPVLSWRLEIDFSWVLYRARKDELNLSANGR